MIIMRKIKIFLSAILALGLFAGCNAKYSVTGDALYVAESSHGASKKLVIDEKGITLKVSPRMGQNATKDVTARLVIDNEALEAFNKKAGTSYKPVPSELITLSSDVVKIGKGMLSEKPIEVSVKAFTDQMNKSGDKFALAFSLKDVQGTDVLEALSSFVYEFEPVIITSVPVLQSFNVVKMSMRQDYSLTAWSFEFRVNMSMLGHAVGVMNNQAILGAYGPGTEIYVRFGDAPIRGDLLQVKHQGTQINTNTQFQDNTWYHIAITSDNKNMRIYVNGELDATLALPGNVNNIKSDGINMITSGGWFRAKCMLSEVRFWTKTITQDQIRNNMFAINPSSEGLEGYWKMNEGSGNTFADATSHGNNALAEGSFIWKDGIRSDGK